MSTYDSDCIFCKIAAGEFGTAFAAQSDHAVAFDDLSPQAPVHVLVVPKRHIPSIAGLEAGDGDLLADMIALANQVARDRGIDASGYRLLTNVGPDAGQTVFHLHMHLLGGKELGPLA
ncbi:MAG: histidine triad nucleotide-binding protein [Thermomicrobiales bacterium]